MKSKTSLINGKLYVDSMKRNWWFGFVVFLAYLFSVTVSVTFLARDYAEMKIPDQLQGLLTGYFTMKSQYIISDAIIAMIFGVAAGIVYFSYLHNKRQVDFFHGQPVRRETLLCTRFASGLTLFAAGYLINLLIAYVVLLAYGASAAAIGGLFAKLLLVVLLFAMLFAFSALSAVLTGNTFAHFQAGFMICFAPFLLMSCLLWFANTYLKSFSLISENSLYYGSAPMYMIKAVAGNEMGIGSVICCILITGLALALALLLYQKRPSESAGAMFAFPVAEPIYRAILTVCCGSLMGSIFYDASSRSLVFTILGALLGMFLAHIFSQVQFKRTVNGMFTAWKPYAITAVAFFAVMAAFIVDIAGYDAYLPMKDEVKSVAVAMSGYNSDITIKTPEGEMKSVRALDHVVFEDEEIKDTMIAMAGTGIVSNASFDEREQDYFRISTNYTIRYTLTNGKQVQRSYNNVPMKDVAEELKMLSTSPEYIQKQQFFFLDDEDCVYLSVYTQGDGDYHSAANRTEKLAFLTALREDMKEHGTPADEAPVAWADVNYATGRYNVSDNLYIYKSYARCLAILDEWQVSTELISPATAAKFVRAEVISYGDEEENVVYTTDDPGNIKAIVESGALLNNYPPMTLRSPLHVRFYTAEDIEKQKQYAEMENNDEMQGMKKEYYGGNYASYEYQVLMGGLVNYGGEA